MRDGGRSEQGDYSETQLYRSANIGGLRGEEEPKAGFGDDLAGDGAAGNAGDVGDDDWACTCCSAIAVGVGAAVEARDGGGRLAVCAASSSVSGRFACCMPSITGV